MPDPKAINTGPGSPYFALANSSSTPLAGAATFTGEWEYCAEYPSIFVGISTDQVSGTPAAGNGIRFQFSDDASTVKDEELSFINSYLGLKRTWELVPKGPYFRVVYTNGVTPQGSFLLSTIFCGSSRQASLAHRFIYTPGASSGVQLNSGSWQPVPGNSGVVVLSSAARTATTTSTDNFNLGWNSAIFSLIVTAVPVAPGSGGLDLQFLFVDFSGNTIVANQALPNNCLIQETGSFRWIIAREGNAMGTNVGTGVIQTVGIPLAAAFEVRVLHADAQSYTYRVNCDLMVS